MRADAETGLPSGKYSHTIRSYAKEIGARCIAGLVLVYVLVAMLWRPDLFEDDE